MKILKYKKMSRGRYKITLEDNEIILYEDIIIKNNILFQKELTLETLDKIMNENKEYEAYDISLSFIEIKLRTELEIINYLEKKDFNSNIINKTIEKLKNNGLINNKKYIEAYVNDKINLSTYGPFKIKRNLMELGLEESDINEYLDTIDNNVWESKLKKIIDKKSNSMKNKSLYMIKNKLKIDLFNLGYDKYMIDDHLSKLNKSDEDNLKKEIEKAYNKYSKKYEGKTLEIQIKNYLYRKGYSVNEIDFNE